MKIGELATRDIVSVDPSVSLRAVARADDPDATARRRLVSSPGG